MKKIHPVVWILIGSVVWLSVFMLLFRGFARQNHELNRIGELRQELENLNYYRRSIVTVEAEILRMNQGEDGPKTAAEFVSRLPELGLKSGIKRISIESLPAKKNQPQGLMELKLTLGGSYADIAAFVQALEKTAVPVQVIGAEMESAGPLLDARIFISVRRAGEAVHE